VLNSVAKTVAKHRLITNNGKRLVRMIVPPEPIAKSLHNKHFTDMDMFIRSCFQKRLLGLTGGCCRRLEVLASTIKSHLQRARNPGQVTEWLSNQLSKFQIGNQVPLPSKRSAAVCFMLQRKRIFEKMTRGLGILESQLMSPFRKDETSQGPISSQSSKNSKFQVSTLKLPILKGTLNFSTETSKSRNVP
jgi:hypothetical protein